MKQLLTLDVEGLDVKGALHQVTLQVPPSQLTGVIGPNGAGKTTLLRCLTADLQPTKGSVRLGGRLLRDWKPVAWSDALAFLPQGTPIAYAFTVEELVGLRARSPEAQERALECMELQSLKSRSLLTLSGGERQRAAVARVLAQDTPVLVLDEPLAHLDTRYQSRLLEFLKAHSQSAGMTVLALHDLRLARHWCDWLVLLKSGQLVMQGEPQEVLTRECLQEVFGTSPNFLYDPVNTALM